MPSLFIPRFPMPQHAATFADRKDLRARLVHEVATAGNAALAGDPGASYRAVVRGHRGVGKSALLLRVLQDLREGKGPGQTPILAPERWVVLYLHGKMIGSPGAIANALAGIRQEAQTAEEMDPLFDLFRDLLPDDSTLPKRAPRLVALVHELLGRDDSRRELVVWEAWKRVNGLIRAGIRGAGASLKELESNRSSKGSVSIAGEVGLPKVGKVSGSASLERQDDLRTVYQSDEERSVLPVIQALNHFFESLRAVRMPTVVVVDDLEELVSGEGGNQDHRAPAVSALLGLFNRLRPTCLLFGMREEYVNEDISRQFDEVHVPLLSPVEMDEVVECWARSQHDDFGAADVAQVRALGRALFAGLADDERVITPDPYLQILASAFNAGFSPERGALAMLDSWLGERQAVQLRRVQQISAALRALELVNNVAAGEPVEPPPLADGLLMRDLQEAGLCRPHRAGRADDSRVVFNPWIGRYAQIFGH
jgi:Cdc6-like AAA superfamily ATPase